MPRASQREQGLNADSNLNAGKVGNSISGQNQADAKTRVAARFWELRSGTFTDVFLTSNNIYSDLNLVKRRVDLPGPGRDMDHTI